MTDTIWLCDVLRAAHLIRDVLSTKPDEQSEGSIAVRSNNVLQSRFARIAKGEVFPADGVPTKFYRQTVEHHTIKGGKDLPPVFCNGYVLIRDDVANIMMQFDLFDRALTPVELYTCDLQPIEKSYFLLQPGVQKATLDIDHSEGVCRRPYTDDVDYEVPTSLDKDKLYSLPEAHEGEDLWVDPNFLHLIFVSDRLGAALKKAKLARALRMYPLLPPINV